MASIDYLSKTEEALASVVTGLSLTGTRGGDAVDVATLTGLDDDAATIPAVVCIAQSAPSEIVLHTGNREVPFSIEIRTNLNDETLAVHRARVATVADSIYRDDIAATLSAAVSEYYVFDVRSDGGLTEEINGETVTTSIRGIAVCCCSDLV
jgi:hypothetical protein